MAQAMTRYLRSVGKGGQARNTVYVEAVFFGDDVDDSVDGVPYELEVFVAKNWNLGQLKAAIGDAVQAKAADLGVTVAANDLFIESFEVGPPP